MADPRLAQFDEQGGRPPWTPAARARTPGSARDRPALSRFSLSTLAHFYRERFAVAVSVNLAYRGAVSIWIFVTLIQPLVFIVIWRTVAGGGSTGSVAPNQSVA